MIEASKHINEINNTLNSMFKVLRLNLSMPQQQIEQEIIYHAINQIVKLLENLYIEQTASKSSKYAKKRIKVDMKIFLKNCDSEKLLKFTKQFKQLHFNLLVQEDPSKSGETQSSSGSELSTVADLSKITVTDPYSDIKQSLKNILMTRCGVKPEELGQFCLFEAQ